MVEKIKRYSTEKYNLPFRGNIVDLVQHHEWILLATEHSEGKNLGLYAVPLRNLKLPLSPTISIQTPNPIKSLVALKNDVATNTVVENTLEIDGEKYDARMIRLAKNNADMLVENQESTLHSLFYALIDEEGDGASEITEVERKTLEYIKANLMDEGRLSKRLDEAIQTYEQSFPFSADKLPGQRVLALDEQGHVHRVPTLPTTNTKEHSVYKTQPIASLHNVKIICGYSAHEVLCVLGGENPEVLLYDVDTDRISFRMTVPQVQDASLHVEEDMFRMVTSISASSYSQHFALGFDDGLFLIFARADSGDSFEQKTLYNTDRSIRTELHEQPVIALHFSMTHDGVEYVHAAAADLTMSMTSVQERIPTPKGKSRGPKKNVRQFVAGPNPQYFYSINEDNSLFMWNSNRDTAASFSVDCGPLAVGCIPCIDNRGNWFWQDLLLIGGASSEDNSGSFVIYPICMQLRNEPSLELSLEGERKEGKILEQPLVQVKGCAEWVQEQLKIGSAQQRKALIEELGTWNDELSVYLLRDVIYKEENPQSITRALELFYNTKHPKRTLIYKCIMDEEVRETTCMLVLDYLRSEDIFGSEDIYPLNLARYSSFLLVRQKALRAYAELAIKKNSEPDNQTYKRAFSIVLESLHDDEDDIVDVAFSYLCDCEHPLIPGVNGVLTAIAVSDERIQRRGIDLLYTKGMLFNPETKGEAQDLLRQVRDSSNERLRYRAFILSLTTEKGVESYLRSIDKQVHTQLLDLEEEDWNEKKNAFDALDPQIEQLFLSAISEENEDRVVDEEEMHVILEHAPFGVEMTAGQYLTYLYCLQTFPMNQRVQNTLREALEKGRKSPKPLSRDLHEAEVELLQEMSFSYQPEIASLGALALARLGHLSALPILLLLVDDRDSLVRSRAIDGLLSFIHEPIVEQRLLSFVLQAPNVAVRRSSKDKAQKIRAYVQENKMQVTRSMVEKVVEWIFVDDVYSQTERLALRYIFESVEVTFTSNTRTLLFQKIQERAVSPKDENLRSKAFAALFTKASIEGDDAVRSFIHQTQDSVYEDIRMLGVARLQQRISTLFEVEPNWKKEWHFLSEEDWKTEGLGAFVQADDGSIYESYAGVNPAQPIIGLPKPLLKDIQLLNRVFFWREHEAITEVVKMFCQHDIIRGDFFATRRFLLSLSLEKVWSVLLQEILDNIQDTEIKGDDNIHDWHRTLWADYLGQAEESHAILFFEEAGERLRSTIAVGIDDNTEVQNKTVPSIDFLTIAFASPFSTIQNRAFDEMLSNFNEEWVAAIILETFAHEDQNMRDKALSDTAIRILYHHGKLYTAIQRLLQHTSSSMVEQGLKHLKTNENAKEMLNTAMVQILLDRIEGTLRSKDGAMSRAFISSHLIDTNLFGRIPKAVAVGEDQQKAYYDLLAELFLYELEKDISSELEEYKKQQSSVKEEIAAIKEKKNTVSFEELSAEEKKKDKDRLAFLHFELTTSPKPEPSKDKAFFSVLSLLERCSEGWVLPVLDHFIFSMDEKISNHAFGIYFSLGVKSHSPEEFLMSMLNNDHARLDDVFDRILSGEFDHLESIKGILTHCTRLSRIDLVFRAFDRLKKLHTKKNPTISDEMWKVLRSSPHPYLRLSSYHHLGFDNEIEILSEPLPSTPSVAYPFGLSLELLDSILHPDKKIEEKEQSTNPNPHDFNPTEEVHLFVQNASDLCLPKRTILQEMFSLSLRDLRRIQASGLHCVLSGIPFSKALEFAHKAQNEDIVLVVSRSHPSYEKKSIEKWYRVMSSAVKKVQTDHWISNTATFDRLMKVYKQAEKGRLRTACVRAMGSVASPEDCATIMEQITEDHHLELARSGHVHGLRILFQKEGNTTEIVKSMLACGKQSESFFLQACAGRVHASTLEKLVLLWFLQRSAYGGSLDMMTSILSSSHQKTARTAAELLASAYDRETFFKKIFSLSSLDTTRLQDPFSNVLFRDVDEWIGVMFQAKDKYVQHYRIADKPDMSPSLAQYREAQKEIESIKTERQEVLKKRNETQNKQVYKELEEKGTQLRIQQQEAERKYKKIASLKHLTFDEWKWVAQGLVTNNPRIRFAIAGLALSVFDRQSSRENALIEIERFTEIISTHKCTSPTWEMFSLSGRVLKQQTAVSFGFGSLASIVRNNRQFDVAERRKALASILHISCAEKATGIRSILSVAFNDPSEKIRRDAFSLALLHHDEIGLTHAEVMEKAIHAVALRNAIHANEEGYEYDSLNHLIISELYRTEQFSVLLRMVREETQQLGMYALEALMVYREPETEIWTYMVPTLDAALSSPSSTVQHTFIHHVRASLKSIATYNGKNKEDKVGREDISMQPLWDILKKSLSHGNTQLVESSQALLKDYEREEVLSYVYQVELLSDDSSIQKAACDYLKEQKPSGASHRVLQRLCDDVIETACVDSLKDCIIVLNDYQSDHIDRLFSVLEGVVQKERKSLAALEIIIFFAGYKKGKQLSVHDRSQVCYRHELFARLLTFLLRRSCFDLLVDAITMHTKHLHVYKEAVDVDASVVAHAELDRVLSDLAAIRYREGATDVLRERALDACCIRYELMTDSVEGIPISEQITEKPPNTGWGSNDWKALRHVLDLNLSFHPILAQKKKSKSMFQYKSACSLMRCRGYIPYAFRTLREILTSEQYSLSWRKTALDLLGETRSPDLLTSLFFLVGMDNKGEQVPQEIHNDIPRELFHGAVSYLGYYHETDRSDEIFVHLLRLASNPKIVSQVTYALCSFVEYKEKNEQHAQLLLGLSWSQHAKRTLYPCRGKKHSAFRIAIYTLIDLYTRLSSGDVPKSRLQFLTTIQKYIQRFIFTTDINAVYEFLCGLGAEDDIALDLEVYAHEHMPLLNTENNQRLIQRISRHSSESELIAMIKQSILRESWTSNIVGMWKKIRAKIHKEERHVIAPDDITSSFFEDMIKHMRDNPVLEINALLGILHHPSLALIQSAICTHIEEEYKGSILISSEILKSGVHTRWVDAVDFWEEVVSDRIEGIEFYRSLIEDSLVNDADFYGSVLDILSQKDFDDPQKDVLISNIRNIRVQWESLQKEQALGTQGLEDQIDQLVQRWTRSLRLISVLEYDGGELEKALCMEDWSVPTAFLGSILDLYFSRQNEKPSQDVLLSVFAKEPTLRLRVIPLIHMHTQQQLIQNSDGLRLFQGLLEFWLKQLDSMLQAEEPDIATWLLLTENRVGLADTSFPSVLHKNISTSSSELQSFWRQSTRNRDARTQCIEQLLIPVCIEVFKRREVSLAGYMCSYAQGWVAFQALTYLKSEHDKLVIQKKEERRKERIEFEEQATLEEVQTKKWEPIRPPTIYHPFVLQSLKYARSKEVREGLPAFISRHTLHQVQQDLHWVRELERRRSNRFMKEQS